MKKVLLMVAVAMMMVVFSADSWRLIVCGLQLTVD